MILKIFGYEIRKSVSHDKSIDKVLGYEQYQYCKPDGTFDYQKYKQIQLDGNKKKIEKVWVLEENIAFLSDYITRTVGDVKFGLCHGT